MPCRRPPVRAWFCLAAFVGGLTAGAAQAQIYAGTGAGGTVVLSNFENDLTDSVIVDAPAAPPPAQAVRPPGAGTAPPSSGQVAAVAKSVPPVPARLEPLIREAARAHGLPAALVAAVAAAESGFDARALSSKGAAGLMQLLPTTARRFDVADRFVAEQSLRGGAAYLRWLHGRFGGDLVRVLAAYNAGEGAVDAAGGVPPFDETQAYVPRVLALLAAYTPLFSR